MAGLLPTPSCSIAGLATVFGVTTTTVRNWVTTGRITGIRTGAGATARRFTPAQVLDFLEDDSDAFTALIPDPDSTFPKADAGKDSTHAKIVTAPDIDDTAPAPSISGAGAPGGARQPNPTTPTSSDSA